MKQLKSILIPLIFALSILLSACGTDAPADDPVDTTLPEDTTAETPPAPAEPKIYKHVLIIGVDGAGTFFKDTDTPNVDRIFADGNVTYEARTGVPAISAHSWTSLLHGVEYAAHQISNGTAEQVPYPLDSPYPSIFRVILEDDPDAHVASICRWAAQNIGIVEDGIGVVKITENGSDIKLAETVCNYVNENGVPKLMYTVFDDADVAGHASGWGSEKHLQSITNIDALIGTIYDAYEALGVLDDTLIMVTADHGGFDRDHGGNMDCEKYVMFAINGESVIKNGAAEDMGIRDVAAICAYALGLEAPEGWTARVPAGIFEGVGGGERPVYIREDNTRYRESQPTPGADSEKYVTNFITDKALEYYLTFDGTTEDSCGNTVEATDDYFFLDGIYGEGIWLDNGYLTIPDYSNDGGAFTIAMWLKIEGLFAETAIVTNKDRSDPKNKGFALSIDRSEPVIKVSIGDGNMADLRPYKLPKDYRDGWVHVVFTYSPEEGKAKISYDFDKFKNITLSEAMSKDALEGLGSLCIGYEVAGDNPYAFNGAIDEFMQFDGYFTDEDLAALASYYGIE
ncbi:MAG: alkaline phosphatase family protein [Clostridia bacterium]|nr:alkaline phosphatase family protein [Clostridia bacterium]